MVAAMRLSTRHCVVLLVCMCACAKPCLAQDANRIVDQYVKAIGGGAKLAKVRTLSMEGTFMRAADGKVGAFTLDTKVPNRYYLELLAGEHPLILASNGN